MIDSEPKPKKYRLLLGGMAVGALALVALGIGWMAIGGGAKIKRPPLPSPNGYEMLVTIGNRVVIEQNWLPPTDKGAEEWRAFLDANPDLSAQAREALGMDSLVPLGFDQADIDKALEDIGVLRNLARLMSATALLAEEEGRIDEAARWHLDTARLGHRVRGGLLIHRLVGFAIEGMGLSGLQRLADDLDSESRREVIQTLEALDRDREPIAETIALDLAWGRETTPRIQYLMMSWSGVAQNLLAPAHQGAKLAEARISTHLRLLMVDLAIRAFRDEQGRPLEALQDLLPEYLDALSLDPFGDGLLIYRVEGDSYRLYSVGPDGIDNDGEPFAGQTDWTQAKGDVTLETYLFEEPAELE